MKVSLPPAIPVLSGVPQDTVLGPLLVLCYSADLPVVVKDSTISMFAEDTKGYTDVDGTHDCHLLQQDLNSISTWAGLRLELNPDKL